MTTVVAASGLASHVDMRGRRGVRHNLTESRTNPSAHVMPCSQRVEGGGSGSRAATERPCVYQPARIPNEPERLLRHDCGSFKGAVTMADGLGLPHVRVRTERTQGSAAYQPLRFLSTHQKRLELPRADINRAGTIRRGKGLQDQVGAGLPAGVRPGARTTIAGTGRRLERLAGGPHCAGRRPL